MGQDQSGEVVRDENYQEETSTKAMCPHCKKSNIATYRCRIAVDDIKQLHEHKILLPFWKADFLFEDGQRQLSYIGCETCMDGLARPAFTHYFEGWEESSHQRILYEEAKLKPTA